MYYVWIRLRFHREIVNNARIKMFPSKLEKNSYSFIGVLKLLKKTSNVSLLGHSFCQPGGSGNNLPSFIKV